MYGFSKGSGADNASLDGLRHKEVSSERLVWRISEDSRVQLVMRRLEKGCHYHAKWNLALLETFEHDQEKSEHTVPQINWISRALNTRAEGRSMIQFHEHSAILRDNL